MKSKQSFSSARFRAFLLAVLTLINAMSPRVMHACETDPVDPPPDTSDNTDTNTPPDDTPPDDTGTDTDPGPGTDTGTDPATDTGTDTGTSTDTATDTSTATDTGTDTDTWTDTETSTDTGTGTDTSTQTGTDTATDTNTDTETATDTDTSCDISMDECSTCDGGDDFDWAGENKFNVRDGNARRHVHEIKVAGTVGRLGLAWNRYHNTQDRGRLTPFGAGGGWRHSWQFELLEETPAGTKQPTYEFVSPTGMRVALAPSSAGHWQSDPGTPYSAVARKGGIDVQLTNGVHVFFLKSRFLLQNSKPYYEARAVTDGTGRTTTLTYSNGNLMRVTEPGGRSLSISYADYTFQSGRWRTFGTVPAAPAAGAWVEFAVPPALSATPFRYLRVLGAKGAALALADVQFFAPGSTTPLAGEAKGTGDNPAAAFDGNPATVFLGNRDYLNLATLDLGAAGATAVARVRILAAPGKEALLIGTSVAGMLKGPDTWSVISKVTASDGQTLSYDYETQSDPYTTQEHPALVRAHYPDGGQANYKYAYVTANTHPMLTDIDDPSYVGNAKQIRYAYYDKPGMLHQEINPSTGGVLASLELDPANPLKRVVRYSDLKQEVYYFDAKQVHVVEKVDGIGRHTKLEYTNPGAGPATAKIDYAGRRTQWTLDPKGRVVSAVRDGKLVHSVSHDPKTGAKTVTHSNQRTTVTTWIRNAQNLRVRHIDLPDGRTTERTYDWHGCDCLDFVDRESSCSSSCPKPTACLYP